MTVVYEQIEADWMLKHKQISWRKTSVVANLY